MKRARRRKSEKPYFSFEISVLIFPFRNLITVVPPSVILFRSHCQPPRWLLEIIPSHLLIYLVKTLITVDKKQKKRSKK